ncbi:MAG: M48 family metallopeptidase [Verrucomicrobia bacterium]|nr:MAG: M48 family metallopeptidase [Verrucomicrobiota bacterium]
MPIAALALVVLRWVAAALLEWINRRHVEAHRGSIPEALRGTVDDATYARSVDYTLAKSRFGQWSDLWDNGVLVAVLFLGALPALWMAFQDRWGTSAWSASAWMFAVGILLSIPSLPWEWWAQFRLEARFGFNTTTAGTWVLDHVKGLLLAAVLGYPLLVLLLKLVDWMGARWWLWGWGTMVGFQVLMLFLAPVVIMPLFNKFTPLPEGSLRDRLLRLGDRTGFSARTIQVMDGSKRSRHSNAFFTGFGRFRKIVLYDTLVAQLTEEELEAVLAHEIGHHRRHHIPQRLAWAAAMSLAGFALVGWLARQAWFLGGFGFAADAGVAPAMLLLALLGGTVTFWFAPLGNLWSRRHEYEADAYAKQAVGSPEPLVGALRKLSEKNLSNLTPHPWYSAFHYSHPTLLEREAALRR